MPLPNFSSDRLRQPIALKPISGKLEMQQGDTVYVAPQAISGGSASVFLPETTASDIYEVEATFVNQGATLSEITCGVDVGNGGTLAATELLAFEQPLPGRMSVTLPTFRMTGADDFMAHSVTGSNNLYLRVTKLI
jgi:hypothetical protein